LLIFFLKGNQKLYKQQNSTSLKKIIGDIMFKKTVLFGILLVALLVLSGCGSYVESCPESAQLHCYGHFPVNRADVSGNCPSATRNINGYCIVEGDATTCSKYTTALSNLPWSSASIAKYGASLCYPVCSKDTDCGSGASEAICYSDSAVGSLVKACAPICTDDLNCIPGLTHCAAVSGYSNKYCVGDSSLSTPAVISADVELSNVPENPKVGDTFFVNIYLTSDTDVPLGSANIALLIQGGAVQFTKNVQDGIFTYAGKGIDKPYDSETDTAAYSVQFANPVKLQKSSRTIFGMVEVKVVNPGTFTVSMVPQVSYAGADSAAPPKINYALQKGQDTAVVRFLEGTNTVCVPKTTANCEAQLECGTLPMDDGCGGKVVCTSQTPTCAEGSICKDNNCVSASTLPTNAPQYDKDAVKSVTDTVSNGQLTKLQKLAAFVSAIKAWLAAQV